MKLNNCLHIHARERILANGIYKGGKKQISNGSLPKSKIKITVTKFGRP